MRNLSFIAPDLRRLDHTSAEVLALFKLEEREPLAGVNSLIDWRLAGHLSRLTISGFWEGALGEILLMPLSGRLPQRWLFCFGLGDRARLDDTRCHSALVQMFTVLTTHALDSLVISLPGRPEQIAQANSAIECFLAAYDTHGGDRDVTIVEPQGPQKPMLAEVERWRLRQVLPR